MSDIDRVITEVHALDSFEFHMTFRTVGRGRQARSLVPGRVDELLREGRLNPDDVMHNIDLARKITVAQRAMSGVYSACREQLREVAPAPARNRRIPAPPRLTVVKA